MKGELVKVLVDEVREPGVHSVTWTGDDAAGRRVSSGVYFARTSVGGEVLLDRLTLIK